MCVYIYIYIYIYIHIYIYTHASVPAAPRPLRYFFILVAPLRYLRRPLRAQRPHAVLRNVRRLLLLKNINRSKRKGITYVYIHTFIFIYAHVCVYMYIYINIYIYIRAQHPHAVLRNVRGLFLLTR